jgi:hypothetical protein
MKKITTIISALLFNLTIAAQTTLVTDSLSALPQCPGGSLLVTFKTTGTFNTGNTFIAQLSNGSGSFASPVNIGSSSFNLGLMFATLPKTLTTGIAYKIRIVSMSPADTSVSPNSFLVLSTAQLNSITTGCKNDTTTLSVLLPGGTYKWSTGATTQSINATHTGTYSVTTTDPLGCKSILNDTVVGSIVCVSTGIVENSINNIFTVYPNPNTGICKIAVTNTNSTDLSITIIDILGKEVFRLSDKNSSAEYKKEINLEHLSTGIYSIQLSIGTDIKTRKIIIQ